MATKMIVLCPTCKRPFEFMFGLLVEGVLAVVLFGKCRYCSEMYEDSRSVRMYSEIDELDYLIAVYHGLYIVRLKGISPDEEDEDEEEPSKIGFRKENE